MLIELTNEPVPEGRVRAYPLRIHEKATFSFEEFEDGLELKLTNNETGKVSQRPYYKLKDIPLNEASKIDTILYFMSNEIGLNLWDSK